MDNKLYNGGAPLGSEVFAEQQRQNAVSDAQLLSELSLGSILAGSEEQSRLRNLAAMEAGFASPAFEGLDQNFFGSAAFIDTAGIQNSAFNNSLNRFGVNEARKDTRRQNVFDTIGALTSNSGGSSGSSGGSSFGNTIRGLGSFFSGGFGVF